MRIILPEFLGDIFLLRCCQQISWIGWVGGVGCGMCTLPFFSYAAIRANPKHDSSSTVRTHKPFLNPSISVLTPTASLLTPGCYVQSSCARRKKDICLGNFFLLLFLFFLFLLRTCTNGRFHDLDATFM